MVRRIPLRLVLPLVFAAIAGGCIIELPKAPKDESDVEEPAVPAAQGDGKSILKKKTQEIGKYDPAAGRIVSDSKVRATNPITGPLEAYGPMVEQISKNTIDQSLLMYYTEHGRWPDYEQFMSEIVKAHNIWLPVLPAKMEYQYDEANHQLVVVYPPDAKAEGAAKAEAGQDE